MPPSMAVPYLDHAGPLALAHRGFDRNGLENTMTAFAAAVDLGASHVETDVHATRDGVLVAFHDDALDRVTDASGPVGGQDWDQVSKARIRGTARIPTLEEVLTSWPHLRVNIDVKSDAAVGPTATVVNRLRAHDRVCIGSFSDRRRRRVLHGLARPTATSGGRTVVAGFLAAVRTRSARLVAAAVARVDCLQVPQRSGRITIVSPSSIAAAHAAGIHMHVWTVNDVDDMQRLLDWGVDGIVTDRLDLLRNLLVARRMWHPLP